MALDEADLEGRGAKTPRRTRREARCSAAVSALGGRDVPWLEALSGAWTLGSLEHERGGLDESSQQGGLRLMMP